MGIPGGRWPWLWLVSVVGGEDGLFWTLVHRDTGASHLFPSLPILLESAGARSPTMHTRAWNSEGLADFESFEPGLFREGPCSSESLCPTRVPGSLIAFFLGFCRRRMVLGCLASIWSPQGHLGGRLVAVGVVPHLGLHTLTYVLVFGAVCFPGEWIHRLP